MRKYSVAFVAMVSAFGGLASAQEASYLDPNLKINEIQVLGTHNSYEMPVDPHVLAIVDKAMKGASLHQIVSQMSEKDKALFLEEHPNPVTLSQALSYDHPSFEAQLDAGVRGPEIDVNPDPDGGQFLDPASYRLLRKQGVTDLLPVDTTDMEKPGFKVLHIPDIDFRSHCPTLKICLNQIKAWSDAHPKHIPLFIMIEAKSQAIPLFPGATTMPPFDAAAFDELDREFLEVMGRDKIITPDDVRGSYLTLREAVLAKNWPTLAEARGKVLFLLLTAHGKDGTEAYVDGHPSLKGRVAFLRSDQTDDYGAFVMYDNALVRQKDIQAAVKAGYLVRTRSDIETYEAKINDMTRANAAFASGAQVVSTDFESVAKNTYGTSYVVRLPGDGPARCNNVATSHCAKKRK